MFEATRSKGLTLALFAACSLAFVTTCARLTYLSGSTPLTLITLRGGLGVIVLFIVAYVTTRSIALPRQAWRSTIAAGIGLTMITFGYMSSVAYIPVGLAALIFYTFPLVVLAIESIRERRMPGPRRLATFVVAFAGLGLALGPSFDTLNPLGIGLAFIGGLGTVVLLFAAARASQVAEPMVIVSYANLFLLPIAAGSMFLFDAYAPPGTGLGWAALGGAGLAYLIGVTAQMFAVKFARASDVSVVHNIEPVVSITVAWFVLNETLSPLQLAGVALVIAAIFAGTRLSKDL